MARYRKLAGELVFLSPVVPEDAELWARWLNDIEVALPLGDEAYHAFTAEARAQDIAQISARQEHVFTIVECAKDRAIGRCLLFSLNKTTGRPKPAYS